nr:hypothetical protein [Paraburkholderia sp. BL8N3]
MAIGTYPGGEKSGSGAPSSFASEADVCQYAVAYAKAEAQRRLLMTLFE